MSVLTARRGFIRAGTKLLSQYNIQVANLDIGGTVMDDKLEGVVTALKTAFRLEGITLNDKKARGPMGISKVEHIDKLCDDPDIRHAWFTNKKCELNQEDKTRIYNRYRLCQIALLENGRHTDLFPEFKTAVSKLGHLKFTLTTGFIRRMVDPIERHMKAQDFYPQCSHASDEVSRSRPHPDAIKLNLRKLGLMPYNLIGVGDTPDDIKEINAAGGISCGVIRRGNILGMSLQEGEYPELMHKRTDYRHLVNNAQDELVKAGADFVMYDFSSFQYVLENITSITDFYQKN